MKKPVFVVCVIALLFGCGESPHDQTAQQSPLDAPPQASPVVPGTSAQAQLNAIRTQAGLGRVKRNAALDAAALAHASDMATQEFMGHIGTDGSDLRDRVDRTGYTWCTLAENVSMGYRTTQGAIEAWRVSPGHYRNLVKENAREFGLADVKGFRVMVLSARRC
jgi:uncharacterized protein YkwD